MIFRPGNHLQPIVSLVDSSVNPLGNVLLNPSNCYSWNGSDENSSSSYGSSSSPHCYKSLLGVQQVNFRKVMLPLEKYSKQVVCWIPKWEQPEMRLGESQRQPVEYYTNRKATICWGLTTFQAVYLDFDPWSIHFLQNIMKKVNNRFEIRELLIRFLLVTQNQVVFLKCEPDHIMSLSGTPRSR